MDRTRTPSQHDVPQRVVDRIWQRYDVRGPDECWPWLLSTGSHGYGQVGWQVSGGRNVMTTAHRVAWIAAHGPIPGMLATRDPWLHADRFGHEPVVEVAGLSFRHAGDGSFPLVDA